MIQEKDLKDLTDDKEQETLPLDDLSKVAGGIQGGSQWINGGSQWINGGSQWINGKS